MALRMEIVLKEDVTIKKNDQLYLDFDRPDDEKVIVYLCVTSSKNGSQQTPKAKVVHAPTMELLY